MNVHEFIRRLGSRCLYHFTDTQILPSIRQHGLLSKQKQQEREIVPPRPGGNEWSHDADNIKGLSKFVNLCLQAQHPMEYLAKQEGRIGPTKFLEISPQVLLQPGVMGCAGVANRSGMAIKPIGEALDEIDTEVLFELKRDFSDLEFRDRFNTAKKAEILVPDAVPVSLIRNL